MEANETAVEEKSDIVVVPNREQKIEEIVSKLMSGEGSLSYTGLDNFKSSPKDFIDYKLKAYVETPAMLYGSMVHCLVLEPEDFDNRYFTLDDTEICSQIGGAKPRATNKYKEWFANESEAAGDRTIVDPQEYAHAKIVAINVLKNRASRKVLDLCPEREKNIEWTFGNFKFRGKVDGRGKKAKFDLKTRPDASQNAAYRALINQGEYLQAAMYMFGDPGAEDYYIISVDKIGAVCVHQLDVHLLEYGMKEYEYLLLKFNECILKDQFDQSHDFWSKRWDGIFTAERATRMFEAL